MIKEQASDLCRPQARGYSWWGYSFVLSLWIVIFGIILYIMTMANLHEFNYYTYGERRFEEKPWKLHVANINLEMEGMVEGGIYCTGNAPKVIQVIL